MIKRPTLSDVDCLVLWPAGSVGERDEREAVRILLELCNKYGYGRIPQLANSIELIWRDSSNIDFHQQQKLRFLDRMEEGRKLSEEKEA